MIAELIHSYKNVHKVCDSDMLISVQISLNGFSFSIQDILSREVFVCETYRFKTVQTWEQALDLLKIEIGKHISKEQIQKMQITFFEKNTQLIPEALFNEEKIEDYYQLAFYNALTEHEQLLNKSIREFECVVVYPESKDMVSCAKKIFGENVEFQNSTVLLLNLLQKVSINKNAFFVVLRNGIQEIVAVDKGKLSFYNIFSYNDKKDILFYLAQIFRNRGLDKDEIDIYIMGVEKDMDEKMAFLSEYYPSVKGIDNTSPNENNQLIPSFYLMNQ